MNTSHRLLAAAWLLAAGAASAQILIQVPTSPVAPGTTFSVAIANNTSGCIDTLSSNVLTLLQPTGELIAPEIVGCGPISICLANGMSATLSYSTPATGPGSAGSFVLLCPHGQGGAVRLDVGTPSAGFPDFHAYPAAIPFGPGGHQIAYPYFPGTDWEIANTATAMRIATVNLGIYTPGGSSPVAFTSLPGLAIPQQSVARVALPLAGLPPGPYTVQADWIDPGLGTPIVSRHGIVLTANSMVDLHLPGGKRIPFGGNLPARFAISTLGWFGQPPPWAFALAVGVLPGSTPLPGGESVPLVADPLVLASLDSGISGLLIGNIGSTSNAGAYCAHLFPYWPVASGITIAHPNVPSLSGSVVRVAAAAFDASTSTWAGSQPEELTLQ